MIVITKHKIQQPHKENEDILNTAIVLDILERGDLSKYWGDIASCDLCLSEIKQEDMYTFLKIRVQGTNKKKLIFICENCNTLTNQSSIVDRFEEG